jgi:hypothetical protein
MFVAYNLRRIINILGKNALQKYLKEVLSLLFALWGPIRLHLSKFKPSQFSTCHKPPFLKDALKTLIFGQLLTKPGGF